MCFIRSTLITVGHVSSLGLLESYSEHSCSSVSVNTCLHFSWGNGYGGNCWDIGRGRANFLRNCKLFSKVVVPFYIATSLVGNVQCTHIFSTACYCLSVDYRRSSGCEVLISISPFVTGSGDSDSLFVYCKWCVFLLEDVISDFYFIHTCWWYYSKKHFL